MEKSKLLMAFAFVVIVACQPKQNETEIVQKKVSQTEDMQAKKAELVEQGYQTFEFVDEETQDTILMQQYYIAFLKNGPNRSQSKEELDSLQVLHLAHLRRMQVEGYASISGPFGDDGDIRGITIYNVPNLKMADSLANMDPMVKSGRIHIEMHPWWAAKGYALK